MTCTLIRNGHHAIPRREQEGARNKRPDVCLDESGSKIWVEAHAPNQGDRNNAVPLAREDTDEFDTIPDEKIILRYTHSLHEKSKNAYKKYVAERIVGHEDAYIVAINGGNIPFFESNLVDSDVPLIVQATLGVGRDTVIIDPIKRQIVNSGILHRDTVVKNAQDGKDQPISTSLSGQEFYRGISGVLYSTVNAYWASHCNGREFIYVHNSNAVNPLRKGWLKFGREYWREKDDLYWMASDQIQSVRILRD